MKKNLTSAVAFITTKKLILPNKKYISPNIFEKKVGLR